MKKNELRNSFVYGIIGALMGGIFVWFIFVNIVNTNNTGMMRMMGMSSAKQNVLFSNDTIDAHFIEQMIPHHEDAITMAKLAQTKAQRPEVKQLAQNIIYSQEKEINQMKEWYKNWFGRELPTGDDVMSQHGMMGSAEQNSMSDTSLRPISHMGMMGNETDVTRLEQSNDFDRAFVEDMIPHHQMAVMMASMLKNSTNRQEMKQLADDIITAQSNEIDQMREWLQTWK